MAWTAQRAKQVACSLQALNDMTTMHGLRVKDDVLGIVLVDADDTTVCRLDYDATLGQFIAREAY